MSDAGVKIGAEAWSGRRSVRWRFAVAVVAAVVALAGAVVLAWPTMMYGRAIPGVATANPVAVVQAADERKAAEEQRKAEELAAQQAAFLASLEGTVQADLTDYFNDPAQGYASWNIRVLHVGLVKVGENKFEGMATMTAGGGPERDIAVEVTADGHGLMWQMKPGALLALLR